MYLKKKLSVCIGGAVTAKWVTSIIGSVGIYGTGNPVHLPNPNPYPTCALTNPNFRCRVFQLIRIILDMLKNHWSLGKSPDNCNCS